MKGPIFFDTNVEFQDVRFLRATAMNKGQPVEFNIMIHIGTGRFEMTEGATAVVTGSIIEVDNPAPIGELPTLSESDYSVLKERDFYKELRLRGYHYSGAFRSVIEARGDGLYGKVKWDSNWVAFMDCLLQINILSKDSRSLLLPTRYFAVVLFKTEQKLKYVCFLLKYRIEKMRINAKEHMAKSAALDPENPCFEVFICPELGTLASGGIEIFGRSSLFYFYFYFISIFFKFGSFHNVPIFF